MMWTATCQKESEILREFRYDGIFLDERFLDCTGKHVRRFRYGTNGKSVASR